MQGNTSEFWAEDHRQYGSGHGPTSREVEGQSGLDPNLIKSVAIGSVVSSAIFTPFSAALAGTIAAAIARSLGYSILSSIGNIALASGVGAAILILPVLMYCTFGPKAKTDWKNSEEKITPLGYAILGSKFLLMAVFAVASAALGAAILGANIGPSVYITLAIMSSIPALISVSLFIQAGVQGGNELVESAQNFRISRSAKQEGEEIDLDDADDDSDSSQSCMQKLTGGRFGQ